MPRLIHKREKERLEYLRILSKKEKGSQELDRMK